MDEKQFLALKDYLNRIDARLTELRQELKIGLDHLERKAEIAIGIHEPLAAAEAIMRERDAVTKRSRKC